MVIYRKAISGISFDRVLEVLGSKGAEISSIDKSTAMVLARSKTTLRRTYDRGCVRTFRAVRMMIAKNQGGASADIHLEGAIPHLLSPVVGLMWVCAIIYEWSTGRLWQANLWALSAVSVAILGVFLVAPLIWCLKWVNNARSEASELKGLVEEALPPAYEQKDQPA